jgi:hypothetical protein
VSCCFVQYYQDLFRDGECFLHIVTLLSKDLTREAGSQLCLDVIVTLIVLLKGNTASKVSKRNAPFFLLYCGELEIRHIVSTITSCEAIVH